MTGITSSQDYPTTTNALSRTLNGPTDAFITELNASGSAFLYSTYFGGSGIDQGNAITIDRFGFMAVAGVTESIDLPLRGFAPQTVFGGVWDGFVVRFFGTSVRLSNLLRGLGH